MSRHSPTRTPSPLAPLVCLMASCLFLRLAAGEAAGRIEILVRGDDMGVAQSINEACIRAYQSGVVRSVEVIVPGAWFPDAVQRLKENPGLDVGVHLCLTSEWDRCKWRPLTRGPSLAGADGFFRPMTSQRKDFPLDTGFLQAPPVEAEVEAELRAQITMALRQLPKISHVSAHMGAATATPRLKAITVKLAREYGLRLEDDGLTPARGFGGRNAADRIASLKAIVQTLQPGRWLIVEHPGLDTPELRAFGHKGYEDVAIHRAGVLSAFTSPDVLAAARDRGVAWISYADIPRAAPAPLLPAAPPAP